jgi:Icc-related predicted phosphoesterase
MRIVHLSDIHLSAGNKNAYVDYYKDALIQDLLNYHKQVKVDIVAITGDLVDRGGHSLLSSDYSGSPFHVFQNLVISPIMEKLQLSREQIIFVPGNHDIDETKIKLIEEKNIIQRLNAQNIGDYLSGNNSNFEHNERIKGFKDFESEFHGGNPNYIPTPNQSTYIYTTSEGFKVGFILLNDSWRCKSVQLKLDEEEDKKHYVGTSQLFESLRHLKSINTNVNICLMHHDFNDFKDGDELKRIIENMDVELVLNGHYHKTDSIELTTPNGRYLGLRCRASFNSPSEKHIDYIPGYQIVDLSNEIVTAIHHRIYNKDNFSFIDDTFHGSGGVDRNESNNNNGYKLYRKDGFPEVKLDKSKFTY